MPAAATADTAPRAAASLGARARPGLAATANEKKAPRDVRETARPEAVSADLLASSFDANAADTTSASPRVDVRRCDGRAGETERADAESAFSLKKAPTTAARVGASRATKPAVRVGDARVTSQEKVTFRERDATAIGADSATVPPTDGTDGVAADLAVATNGASSDADVPGDVPGDVEEPIAVVPDAPSTSSLADAYVADVTATDQPVVPASRPPADTADAAATEVSAAAAGASGARDRIDLGTGAGAGMGTGTGTEAGTSSPTTPLTTTPDETVAIPAPQEGFQEETSSSFSPPSDGSDASAKEEAFSDRPTARPAVPSSANANADVAAGTAAPAGPERPRASPNGFTRGDARSSRSPYFGGGRDLGRSYAPRGFRGGSVPREPECGEAGAGKRFGSTSSTTARRFENTDRRYIVRFRENVTDARFFELKREVEDGFPSGESPRRPRLRAAAPGFRVAVLGGVTRASKRRFRETHAGDLDRVEPDAEIAAFGERSLRTTETPTTRVAPRPLAAALRPRASRCAALAQTLLTDGQWNLDRVSTPEGAPSSKRSSLDGAFAAPECLCGRGVDVYVVDTGARTSHSEFRGRVGVGADFVRPSLACDSDSDGSDVSGDVRDDSGHGTHVAGTALGSTSGLAKCATLRPVRILDGDGKGKSSSILEALDWIADRAAEAAFDGRRSVVSMSLGGPRSQAVDDAVAEMTERHGVPVIVAAGNEARDAANTSPAGGRAAVAVGSTSCYPDPPRGGGGERCVADVVSPFSNHGDAVAVYAPGHGVRSAWMSGDDAFKESSGTSMAAPLVAGAAALYLEKYPAAAPRDVARALSATATAVTWDDEREGKGGGGGMLDLEAMLRVAPG